MTGCSFATWPPGFWRSIADGCSIGPAITIHFSVAKKRHWRRRNRRTLYLTKNWPRKKSGFARELRPDERATKAECGLWKSSAAPEAIDAKRAETYGSQFKKASAAGCSWPRWLAFRLPM